MSVSSYFELLPATNPEPRKTISSRRGLRTSTRCSAAAAAAERPAHALGGRLSDAAVGERASVELRRGQRRSRRSRAPGAMLACVLPGVGTTAPRRSRADLLGFCGYRWDPYHRGEPYDTGYGVVGKPAYEVLRSGFAAIRDDRRHHHAPDLTSGVSSVHPRPTMGFDFPPIRNHPCHAQAHAHVRHSSPRSHW